MKTIKNISFNIIYTFLFFIFFSLVLTILNYFNIINYNILSILKIITTIITLMFSGLLMGKKAKNKGWLEGLKISSLVVSIFILITLFLNEFDISKITFYIILIISGILGSIIGINTKKKPI